MDLLDIRNLQVDFKLHDYCLRALHDVSFSIRESSTVALVGESGSGKTVCSQAIMGLLPNNAEITKGDIYFHDPKKNGSTSNIALIDPSTPYMRQLRSDRISLIFQEPMTSLSPLHIIGDQIQEAITLHKDLSKKDAKRLTEEMLRLVGFPDGQRAYRTYPFELSGGMRQRAVIAMALVCNPALLIADEPTTALDVTIQAQILALLKELQEAFHMAILLITHDLGIVANLAEDVVVLYRGNIVEKGPKQALFENPQHPYLQGLLRAVPRLHMDPKERLIPLRSIEPKVGHLFKADKQRHHMEQKGQPLLSFNNLYKTYTLKKKTSSAVQKIEALKDISLTLKRGECLGLVGESGCGKTTLCKSILRAIPLDKGDVIFHDEDQDINVRTLKKKELINFRKRIQYIFQDPYSSLNPRMQISEILSEPLAIHGEKNKDYMDEVVKELLELVGLDPHSQFRYPHNFSGGQRQRIGIARSLALHPDILICDEPVSALDVSIQAQILNLLKDLQNQLGLTYLFISHNMAVIHYIADEIAVMYKGQIVEYATREELFKNPVHPYTQSLLKAIPDPDLNNLFDFDSLKKYRSNKNWPDSFARDNNEDTILSHISDTHYVRVKKNSPFKGDKQ